MEMTREEITEIVNGYLQHGLVENNPEKIALAAGITISGNGRLEARGINRPVGGHTQIERFGRRECASCNHDQHHSRQKVSHF